MQPVFLCMQCSQRQCVKESRGNHCVEARHTRWERAGIIRAVKSEEGNIQGGKGDDSLTWK